MSFFDKKVKSALVTILICAIYIFMFGTLTQFMHRVSGTLLTATTANYIVFSFVYIIAWLGYSFVLGMHSNWGAVIALGVVTAYPFVGLLNQNLFDYFFGWGTAALMPALYVFKIHDSVVATCIVLILLYALTFVLYFLGKKYKKSQEW